MSVLSSIKECLSNDVTHLVSTTRVVFFISLFSVIFFTGIDVYYKHEFDTVKFCGGVTALFIGFGFAKKE